MAEICRKIRGQGQSDQSVKLFQALSRSRRRITWPPAVVCAVRRDEPPDWGVHIQSELISRRRRRELGGVRSVIDCRVDLVFDCVGPASRKQLLNTFERKANSGGGQLVSFGHGNWTTVLTNSCLPSVSLSRSVHCLFSLVTYIVLLSTNTRSLQAPQTIISFTFNCWHKSFTLDDVKLAELCNSSFERKNVTH